MIVSNVELNVVVIKACFWNANCVCVCVCCSCCILSTKVFIFLGSEVGPQKFQGAGQGGGQGLVRVRG